jgi:hypothetical protein
MKIQRSVNTTIDWSLDSLERTKELDHKLKTAHDSLEGAYARLPRTSDFTSLLSKIEAVRGELAEIEKEYKESKSEWRKALIMKSKNPSLSFSMQDEAVRKIEDCGRRIESTILPGLEDALKSDARISKLEPIKQALNKTAYAIDWAQRMVFLAGAVMAAFPPKPI